MSKYSEPMIEYAKLYNQGKKQEAYKVMEKVEIENNTPLAHMVITFFDITKENILQNIEYAKKLSKIEHQDFRVGMRVALIQEILEQENVQ